MEFGFGVPTSGAMASPDALKTLVRRGEELGFSIVGVPDHIVIPNEIRARYPYSESGQFARGDGAYLEQLTLLTYLAAQTSSIRFLTSVMVLPHRNPVHTAKALATIDVLSKGRLTVGCGVGWFREEFEALGAPPFDDRGAVGNEYLRAFKELWTSDNPTFDGKYCRFTDITFAPKPVQQPHPPIWIGGESPAALRRAARLGDGWYPIGANPRFPVRTATEYADVVVRLRRYADDAGRDLAEIDLAYNAGAYGKSAQILPNGERRAFTGTSEQVAGDVHAFEQLGVRHLMLGFHKTTLAETLGHMEQFMGLRA